MVENSDKLLPLAIMVFGALVALIVAIVRLVRSGRVPLLAAGGDGDRPSAKTGVSGE